MLAIVSVFLTALLAGSLVYCALILLAVRSYLRQPRPSCAQPPLSILKPLSGAEDRLEQNLRSFFEQDYPEFEILAAVRDPDDAAALIFRRLQQEYPQIASRLIVTGEPPYANAKVFSLARMTAAAQHDLLMMSDSDIHIAPGTLNSVAADFADPKVFLATCPYRAVAGPSFWSALEAEGMNTEFLGGLLVARLLSGVNFAVGPTIVARRQVLEIVGFDRLKEYLAEDFVMGKVASEAGMGVILSRTFVEHHIGSENLRQNFSHRLRWARSTRRSRPFGYVGQLFTFPLALFLMAWILQPGNWTLLLPTLVMRALAAWAVSERVLGQKVHWGLLPIQDLFSFVVWIAAFFGNTIIWRGRRYLLHPDGRFELQA